jgi:hypothetical protein
VRPVVRLLPLPVRVDRIGCDPVLAEGEDGMLEEPRPLLTVVGAGVYAWAWGVEVLAAGVGVLGAMPQWSQ